MNTESLKNPQPKDQSVPAQPLETAAQPTPSKSAATPKPVEAKSSFDSDLTELELLRSEIESLQIELSDRDQQLAASRNSGDSNEEESQELQELVEKFELRMKSVTGELEDAEDRIRTLNDLLQATEEANMAERDEREHMEKWLA